MTTIIRENDNIYLNVVINNTNLFNDGTISSQGTIAEYSVTKTLPIVDKASDYYCSVIRFDIPLQFTPLYVIPIIPASNFINPQPNPNLTPMIIGITYLGVDYPQNIIYVADNIYPTPVQNIIGKQVITPYYFVYTYQNLITAINVALQAAITASGFILPATINPPYFYLDSSTELINLIVPDEFITGVGHPIIYVNTFLLNYLETFRCRFLGSDNPNGKDFIFILDEVKFPEYNQSSTIFGDIPTVPLVYPARPLYWRFTQEYTVLNYWTSLRKIIVSTNTIPINNEFVPAQDNNSGLANTFPILTDFTPEIEFAGQSRSIAYYNPTSQYRLVDLINNDPIYKINLKLYWEDKTGNIYPIFIPRFQQANIKLAFLRKSLYKPMNQLLYK